MAISLGRALLAAAGGAAGEFNRQQQEQREEARRVAQERRAEQIRIRQEARASTEGDRVAERDAEIAESAADAAAVRAVDVLDARQTNALALEDHRAGVALRGLKDKAKLVREETQWSTEYNRKVKVENANRTIQRLVDQGEFAQAAIAKARFTGGDAGAKIAKERIRLGGGAIPETMYSLLEEVNLDVPKINKTPTGMGIIEDPSHPAAPIMMRRAATDAVVPTAQDMPLTDPNAPTEDDAQFAAELDLLVPEAKREKISTITDAAGNVQVTQRIPGTQELETVLVPAAEGFVPKSTEIGDTFEGKKVQQQVINVTLPDGSSTQQVQDYVRGDDGQRQILQTTDIGQKRVATEGDTFQGKKIRTETVESPGPNDTMIKYSVDFIRDDEGKRVVIDTYQVGAEDTGSVTAAKEKRSEAQYQNRRRNQMNAVNLLSAFRRNSRPEISGFARVMADTGIGIVDNVTGVLDLGARRATLSAQEKYDMLLQDIAGDQATYEDLLTKTRSIGVRLGIKEGQELSLAFALAHTFKQGDRLSNLDYNNALNTLRGSGGQRHAARLATLENNIRTMSLNDSITTYRNRQFQTNTRAQAGRDFLNTINIIEGTRFEEGKSFVVVDKSLMNQIKGSSLGDVYFKGVNPKTGKTAYKSIESFMNNFEQRSFTQ